MLSRFRILLFSVIFYTESRVTFPYSEVLQQHDLVDDSASFSCDKGCKVYTDLKSDDFVITQNTKQVATFAQIVGSSAFTPAGLQITAGSNYKIVNRGNATSFVFYSVQLNSPNFGTTVVAPQQTIGVMANRKDRFVTVLSSFKSIKFYTFSGKFPTGFPRIISTGFDAASDDQCQPVYQARSQSNAENSWPVIYSPIMTVDFGSVANHSVSCFQQGTEEPLKNGQASTVYMSPGYVGCSYNSGQQYYSALSSVKDSFTLDAKSLDVSAASAIDTLYLNVNEDKLKLDGATPYSKHYGQGTFEVSLSWTRSSSSSYFAVQLDFGNAVHQAGIILPLLISLFAIIVKC